MDKTSKMSVREKTERARNFDRIFELLFGNVRLSAQFRLRTARRLIGSNEACRTFCKQTA